MLGATTSATFPAATALAALALSRRGFYRPFDATGLEQPKAAAPTRIAVVSIGIWRGEGMALIEAVD
jgi:3-oxoacyl-[acyl-carrier-protein] synthase II